jgi:PAS domain-containing protein
MPPAGLPRDEAGRLEALRALGILDTPPDEAFDAIVQAASLACDKPISLISLLDQHRQWFKANKGLEDVPETPRELAFCAYSILGEDILEVSDATADGRFADNPLVQGAPHIRFYAGMPLRLTDGHQVGTLCIIDRLPGQLNDTQRAILRKLGQAAARLLEGWAAQRLQRQSLKNLAEDRERLANLVEAGASATWEWHVPTGAMRLHDRWRNLTGRIFSDAEDMRASWHPDDQIRSDVLMDRHLAGETEKYSFEGRMRHLNGRWIWIQSQGTVVARTPAGAPEWVFGWAKDITARMTREESLRKSEKFLRETGKLAGVGGWELDLATDAFSGTEETFRIHGLPPGVVPTLDLVISGFAPKAQVSIRDAIDRATAAGTAWDLELPYQRPDGAFIWVRTAGAAVFAGGTPVRLVGAVQDVTARVNERLLLQRTNERVTLATECAGVGVWEWDLATNTVAWDATMCRLYGRPPQSTTLPFSAWQLHVHPLDRDAAEAAVRECRNGLRPLDTSFRIVWQDGSVHAIRAVARRQVDADGVATHLIGINLEITDARRPAAAAA